LKKRGLLRPEGKYHQAQPCVTVFQQGVARDKTAYQIADKNDSRKLAEFLCKEGQFLLPMVERITGAERAVDELIDVAGRATLAAVLTLSAQEVVGPKHPGKAGGEITW
jgi:hypothetical protein